MFSLEFFIVIKIHGRANFRNMSPLKFFVGNMGKEVIVDKCDETDLHIPQAQGAVS